MIFPRLYKKTSTGAIQYWEIRIIGLLNNIGRIETEFGQLDTESPQVTHDDIKYGKNIGKKNETSVEQQTEAEARAKWEKQKKKGYVESILDAQNDQVDALIEGGIVPMLAHKFAEQGHKIKYPAFVQPKLDGIRCIAILKDCKCTLWSRTRKLITSMPHIVEAIEKGLPEGDFILDGEIYNHDFRNNFETIVSLVRQEEPDANHRLAQYHVYDIVTDGTFKERATKLRYLRESLFDGVLVKVVTLPVENEAEVHSYFTEWRNLGYEGCMVRNAAGKYVNKRSYDLLKVKEFEDSEFKIIGIDEGRGKLAGHVGAFVCLTKDGKEFLAKMSGETARLKDYFDNHSLWQGKVLTVQYQGLTGKEGVPRFPVGIAIRDYE